MRAGLRTRFPGSQRLPIFDAAGIARLPGVRYSEFAEEGLSLEK